jgi:hypothetical protein
MGEISYVMRHGRRIEVETADTGIAPKRRRRFTVRWVKLPRNWITTLERSNSVNTYQLALRILWAAYEDKRGDGVVTLSQAAPGMSRTSRKRAAQELIDLCLIVPLEPQGERTALRVKISIGSFDCTAGGP